MELVRLTKRLVGGQKLTLEDLRKTCPLRNPDVQTLSDDQGNIFLDAPLTEQKGFMGFVARLAKAPNTKRFELEEVGAFVWSMCDGETTVEGIGKKLHERFKMSRFEAETALAAFLQTLGRRGLITLVAKKK